MSSPEGTSNQPTIKFTRKRTTTKTRTAASSARRRHNLPLCHASGENEDSGGKDQHSWFARKSTMMTDDQIRSHLVSGGAKSRDGSDGVSFIGDMIVGAKEKKKKKSKGSRPKFAWEEDDEVDDVYCEKTHVMTAAPTLMDIMDEKDETDLMSPLEVNKAFNAHESAQVPMVSKKRPRNEALAHLAIFFEAGSASAPTNGNSSIGWKLLRAWGYSSRLGVALVPLHKFDKSDTGCMDSLDENATHEAKWITTKRLRAIHLPSIQNNNPDTGETKNKVVDVGIDTTQNSKVLVIPPPKLNKHGLRYDPFLNAPEFRVFHEHRKRIAQKHSKGDQFPKEKKRQRYMTDDLSRSTPRPWEDTKSNEKDDFDDDSDHNPHDHDNGTHYAADRNYEHFIGTKTSSGFAMEDEDDANVYDEGDSQDFPQRNKFNVDGDMSNYSLEVQSPVTSDNEDVVKDFSLFENTNSKKSNQVAHKLSDVKGENLTDAWGAWGFGVGVSAVGSGTSTPLTKDGKPPLSGFLLARKSLSLSSDGNNSTNQWEGPRVPSGFVLKRHVFTEDDNAIANLDEQLHRADAGLGLDLTARQSRHKHTKRVMPRVLPNSEKNNAAPQKMLAKDGSTLDFHAVKESMKNRFVSGTKTTSQEGSHEITSDIKNMKKDDWIDVTISTWLPVPLLCKRWGVPIPSDYAGVAVTVTDVKRSGEEEYFQNTVYDPAVAGKSNRVTLNESSNHINKPPETKLNDGFGVFDALGEEAQRDDKAAPNRPDESIFQSIFDVDSDMGISDENDSGHDANADVLQHATELNGFDIHGRARKKRQQVALGGGIESSGGQLAPSKTAVMPSIDNK